MGATRRVLMSKRSTERSPTMTDEARKQTEDEASEDLELTDDTAANVAGGTVKTSDIPVTKPIDKPTP